MNIRQCMNVYYCKNSKWEVDYFQNDIFKRELYNIDINFIFFDNKTEINSNKRKNIIIASNGISLDFLENMIKKLKPFVIFHLSDEFGKHQKYYNLYNRQHIKILFHQHNHENVDYKINHLQIPLGYASGYLLNNYFINCKTKKYDFSFIGALKGDRKIMLDKFKNNFKKSFIHTGITKWRDGPSNQNITPNNVFNIYKNSLFVPIGRGSYRLDCYRLYEAIVAGAIPVICGTMEEINFTFNFNNNPPPNIVIAETWDKAIILCKKIYNDKYKICEIINSNSEWFQIRNKDISKKINMFL